MIKSFMFDRYEWDAKSGQLSLFYACNGFEFEEKLLFPGAPFTLTDKVNAALNRVFFLLHLAAGVSYYKAFGNPEIEIKSGALTREQAAFFNDFYYYGLAQFGAENNLKLHFDFPFDAGLEQKPFDVHLKSDAFVPVGGGKDSCVSIERLRRLGMTPTLFSVNTARPIADCKALSGFKEVTVRRIISPVLIANNASFYNGHVPITGIIAFILAASALLYDKRFVVMSCEGSADEANFDDVNHQWSKSSVFEKSFTHLMAQVLPDFRYFSLLRPMTEMQIAAEFAQKCEKYFDVFTSCNHAFRLDEKRRIDRWCGACDKCRFVFLALAPFMDREKLIKAVGNNPLNDPSQEQGYRALLGLGAVKPFECVGTYDECRLAFLMLSENPEWQNDVLVEKLAPELQSFGREKLREKVFAKGDASFIPKEFSDV